MVFDRTGNHTHAKGLHIVPPLQGLPSMAVCDVASCCHMDFNGTGEHPHAKGLLLPAIYIIVFSAPGIIASPYRD